MAFTQSDYEELKKAYASGHLSVQYGDKKVTYRSMTEMKQALDFMVSELGIASGNSKNKILITTSKGLE